ANGEPRRAEMNSAFLNEFSRAWPPIVLLGFAASSVERHIFHLSKNALAFGQGELRPRFQRHARKQTGASTMVAKHNNHQYLVAVQWPHSHNARRQHVEDRTICRLFARQADIAGQDSNTACFANRACCRRRRREKNRAWNGHTREPKLWIAGGDNA